MHQAPLLERHPVVGALTTLVVLVVVGWVTGTLLGQLLARLVHLALAEVSGRG